MPEDAKPAGQRDRGYYACTQVTHTALEPFSSALRACRQLTIVVGCCIRTEASGALHTIVTGVVAPQHQPSQDVANECNHVHECTLLCCILPRQTL